MLIECRAPAKLILSGEHAVVYGAPALSMAINLYGFARIKYTPSSSSKIEIKLTDLQQYQAWSFQQAWNHAIDIEARFLAFQQASLNIRQVCNHPFDLPLLTLFHFEQNYGLKPGHWQIEFNSDIWQARGLGSSAALIVSLLAGLFKHYALEDLVHLFELSRLIESRQHGQSSGLDPATLIQGGFIRFQADQYQTLTTANQQAIWLIDTGLPQSSTGECVAHVKQQFGKDRLLWQAFENCTNQLHQAWLSQNQTDLQIAIQQNQILLTQIGVVPAKVQTFIQQLQPLGAAKVCGAGSINGEQAGVVMLISDQSPQVICDRFGYKFQAVQLDLEGVRCEVV